MNHWARMLSLLPATHQRAIARANRISLPRGSDAAVRSARLRQALCHAATVRVTFALLEAPVREAIRAISLTRGGLRADALVARYGAVRSARDLLADPRARSIAEQLVLLGWLMERPATPFHPARWLVPPEVRRWLPAPVQVVDLGPAPAPGPPPVLRAAAAILLASAESPLALRADGQPRRSTIRLLADRLAPMPIDQARDLLRFVLPLLETRGLVATLRGACALTPAGQRFLQRAPREQLDILTGAWVALPPADAWLAPLLRDRFGLDLPLLRRRLLIWIEALPEGRLIDPASIAPALADALGPLADAQTHGFRIVQRVPWRAGRAAAILDAALRGPLRWLGLAHWPSDDAVFRAAPALPERAAAPWRHGADGLVIVPHAGVDAAVLRLLPYAAWHAADVEATTYQLSAARLARADGRGWSPEALRALLAERIGPPPAGWGALLAPQPPALRLVQAEVLVAEQPAVLTRASRASSVRHAIDDRLAPGIALLAPGHANRLVRGLARQGLAVERPPAPGAPAPAELTPHECAQLLELCAFYRQHAPPDAPQPPSDLLEARLRAGLTPTLRAALDATDTAERREAAPPVASDEEAPPLGETIAALEAAIHRRATLAIGYDTAGDGDPRWRTVRPLMLECHGDVWLLRAYCAVRRAERTFRVDRIVAIGQP